MKTAIVMALVAALTSATPIFAEETCVFYRLPNVLLTTNDWRTNQPQFCKVSAVFIEDGWTLVNWTVLPSDLDEVEIN